MVEEIGVFSEEHARRLTGISPHQLRSWHQLGFFKPSYGSGVKGEAYGRVYSFKDIVALRVLNELRNRYRISLKHLREVSGKLEGLSNEKWSRSTLYIADKKVVVEDGIGNRREVVTGQYVMTIELHVVISSTKQAIRNLNIRGGDLIGQIRRSKFVDSNDPVIAGTRIRVDAIKNFSNAGYDIGQIIAEYPSLTPPDILAAILYKKSGDVVEP